MVFNYSFTYMVGISSEGNNWPSANKQNVSNYNLSRPRFEPTVFL